MRRRPLVRQRQKQSGGVLDRTTFADSRVPQLAAGAGSPVRAVVPDAVVLSLLVDWSANNSGQLRQRLHKYRLLSYLPTGHLIPALGTCRFPLDPLVMCQDLGVALAASCLRGDADCLTTVERLRSPCRVSTHSSKQCSGRLSGVSSF